MPEKLKEKSAEPAWRITYPNDCIRYVEAFRRHFWDHNGVCKLLDEFFRDEGSVQTVCELGSGAGTNLGHLSDLGYRCYGYDCSIESVEMSISRAKAAAAPTEFRLMDFFNDLPEREFDAVLSLFVPISLADMRDLAMRAHRIVRPGGYFACMLLAVQEEFETVAENTVTTTEHLEIGGEDVLRFNFFAKDGNRVAFEGVYLANSPGGLRMFKDRDTYDLMSAANPFTLPESHFERISRQRVYGKPNQAPPMSFEVLDIYRKR